MLKVRGYHPVTPLDKTDDRTVLMNVSWLAPRLMSMAYVAPAVVGRGAGIGAE
jgi:hypothetical protein